MLAIMRTHTSNLCSQVCDCAIQKILVVHVDRYGPSSCRRRLTKIDLQKLKMVGLTFAVPGPSCSKMVSEADGEERATIFKKFLCKAVQAIIFWTECPLHAERLSLWFFI